MSVMKQEETEMLNEFHESNFDVSAILDLSHKHRD